MQSYFIEYTVSDREAYQAIQANDPVVALNNFHRWIQTTKEVSTDRRTVLRPKLKPNEYVITSMFILYQDYRGDQIKSYFDLPKCANPDISAERQEKKEAKAADQAPANFFPFHESCKDAARPSDELPAQR